MPELHRAFKAAMLQRVAEIAALGAYPVNAFAVWIGFGRRLVRGGFTNRVDLLDRHSFLLKLVFGFVLVQPAHLLRDPRLSFIGVAVFVEQLHVSVRARIAFLHELLVIVLVPFLIGMFLSGLL